MAEIRPFRGLRYDAERAGDLSLNLCPTYVLSPPEKTELDARSPHNVIQLELAYDWGSDAGNPRRYERAAATLRAWLSSGVLQRDDAPSLYVVEERFAFRGGQYRRIGLTAAVRVEPYATGVIRPHEGTEAGPTADRFELMKAARANFSPLMVLYREGRDAPVATLLWQIARRTPDALASPPGQPSVRMWRVTEAPMIGALAGAFRDTPLFIADGHHRYEAALQYRDFAQRELGAAPDTASRFRMMTLIAIDDPGLFLLGYHRAVENASDSELEALRARVASLCELREWRPPAGRPGPALEHELARTGYSTTAFGVVGMAPETFHVATMKTPPGFEGERYLTDYARLHEELLGPAFSASRQLHAVNVRHDAGQAVADVAAGRCQMAFVMRPVPQSLVEDVITDGMLLPVKSTYFHPKLSAGVVMQSLDGGL